MTWHVRGFRARQREVFLAISPRQGASILAVTDADFHALQLSYSAAFEPYKAIVTANAEKTKRGEQPSGDQLLAEKAAWEKLDFARRNVLAAFKLPPEAPRAATNPRLIPVREKTPPLAGFPCYGCSQDRRRAITHKVPSEPRSHVNHRPCGRRSGSDCFCSGASGGARRTDGRLATKFQRRARQGNVQIQEPGATRALRRRHFGYSRRLASNGRDAEGAELNQ